MENHKAHPLVTYTTVSRTEQIVAVYDFATRRGQ